MANKNNGLWLSLGIDISEFEAAFSAADKVSRKQRAAIEQNLKKISDSYAIQANKAKLAGDGDKARALAVEALTAKVKLLTEAEANYAKMLERAKAGGNAKEIAAATREYNRAILERQRAELALQGNKFSANNIFGGIRGAADRLGLGGLVQQFDAGTAAAASFGVSAGALATGIGVAAAAAYGATKAFTVLSDSMESAQKTELALYNIMRRTGLSGTDADSLADTFAMGGVEANEGITTLQRLNKQILAAGANGNETTKALQKWGVALTDNNGKLKPYLQQLEELSKGYQRAAKSGEQLEYLTETLGTRGASLSKLLADFNVLRAELDKLGSHVGVEEATIQAGANDVIDKLLQNSLSHATELPGRAMLDVLGEMKSAALDVSQAFREWFETPEMQTFFKETAQDIKEVIRELRDLALVVPEVGNHFKNLSLTEKISNASPIGLIRNLYNGVTGAKASVGDNDRLDRVREGLAANTQQVSIEQKQAQAAATAKLDAQKKANKELQDALYKLTTDETQQQLDALNKQVEAWRQANANETEIAKFEALRREEILKTAEEKIRAEKEKTARAAKAAAEQSAREAELAAQKALKAEQDAQQKRMSAAEQALTSQKKLWRAYLKMGDTQEFQNYALKYTLKSKGIKASDYASMNSSNLTGYMNAMQRFNDNTWLSGIKGSAQGQITNNNSVTINFDNTVLDNVSAMDILANKVADIIQPAIEKAVKGQGVTGAYGY